MSSGAVRASERESSTGTNGKLLVALPESSETMTQDAEWCVVRVNGSWRQIRFHDYEELYSVPGLYEKVIYDILRCDSPKVVRSLLEAELSRLRRELKVPEKDPPQTARGPLAKRRKK